MLTTYEKTNIDPDYSYTGLPKKPDILLNIHTGKTGGSTLNEIITQYYTENENINCIAQPEQYYPYNSIRKPQENFYSCLSPQLKQQVKYTGGHIGLEVLNFLPQDKNVKAFTLIRDPMGLILSNYWYALKYLDKESLEALDLSSLNSSLIDFVKGIQKPLDVLTMDSLLINFIKGTNYNNSVLRGLSRNNQIYDNEVPITEDIFNEIKNNIKKDFLFVGLLNRFDESILALRRIMGWKFDENLFYKMRNITPFKMPESSYSESLLDQVSERFVFEKRLYTWLEKRFDSLIKLLGDDFEAEVILYKRLNYLYQTDSPEFKKNLQKMQEELAL